MIARLHLMMSYQRIFLSFPCVESVCLGVYCVRSKSNPRFEISISGIGTDNGHRIYGIGINITGNIGLFVSNISTI